MRTLQFGRTRCLVGPSWVVTTLPSGAEVHAHPQNSEGQRQTAKRLGYGDDLAAMTRDHDPLHAALAEWLGMKASTALRHAAGEPVSKGLADLEEAAVVAVQAYCRALGRWPWDVEAPSQPRAAELRG
ncbi:hypothetical protein LRS10_13745 [Phenylobacterium sp. J426]|uniref:hypothetical protein n=1 Tax=Phenylobacterium sp. J426 TaxID=2898439 RepID=UPI002151D807|nr:hypothetical protein [Phenylobacterium sp. J426]MCR5875157.1 hypothetical protein [Phenylobacterium sp. J426]